MGCSLISPKLLFLLICLSWSPMASRADVTYDAKSFTIDGKRRILISGSIHYPRSTPHMWPDLIQKAKLGGLDVVETYVFWNGHEPSQGQYNFEGRYDLVRFVKLVQQAGLYLHLRIGPYVCAEWNFGGLPVWLKFVPGIEFRADNGPYKKAMQRFTEKIVNLMKSEKLFQPQGGPIILAQIENEYDLVQYYLGATGKAYSNWAANMAVGLNTGVPWVMCKQEDAPDPVINSCNGFYCEGFFPNKNNKPKMWTENWTGWLQNFGGPAPYRPVEDIAYSVARFIQNRGSFINYYMYHGGTNFGRTSGGPFIATSYDYDAPIDEYGLPKEPKWTHLTNLHVAIKKCEPALVSADPQVSSLGKNQEAHLFQDKKTGVCAAFLANYDPKYPVNVSFWNMNYNLPPWSVSILPDCKDVVFNTAMVSGPSVRRQMLPISGGYKWESYTESPASSTDPRTFSWDGLREQVRVTWDTSDYLWYMIDVTIKATDLKDGKWPVLSVESAGHALDVFINGQLAGYDQGNADNPKVSFNAPVNLKIGVNKIALLSASVGLANIGLHFDQWNVGILGPVTLNGLAEGTRDLSKQKWFYKIGMEGEALSLYASPGTSSVKWVGGPSLATKLPLTWYKTTIDAPEGNEALAIDMKSMGKGEMWINGESIGRHWPGYKAVGDNCGTCNYGGEFNEKKCLSGCGEASQRWYHVPRSWVKPKGNLLVVFEERGGDPTGIALVKRV